METQTAGNSGTFKERIFRWAGIEKDRPVTIKAYRSFGSPDRVFIIGRVLRERIIYSHENDSRWKTLADNIHRFFFSQPVRKARLKISLQDREFFVVTGRMGYFRLYKKMDTPLISSGKPWLSYTVCLETNTDSEKVVKAKGGLLLPFNCDFGIITDIDDTVIQTEISSFLRLRMLYLTFMKNATKRKPVRQAAAFLKALEYGSTQKLKRKNPVFYVSKSPWNLYEILTSFLRINNMPKGPLFLRDFGIPFRRIPIAFKGFKFRQIKKIMKAYPDLPFVLIGDSGEKDADIYLQISQLFPGRIKAIYIRDIKNRKRTQRVEALIKESGLDNINLVKTYKQAALHAAKIDLLSIEKFTKFKKRNKELANQDEHER